MPDTRLYRIVYTEQGRKRGRSKPLGILTLRAYLDGFRWAKRHSLVTSYKVLTLSPAETRACRKVMLREFT
jgi:hypothetical protein